MMLDTPKALPPFRLYALALWVSSAASLGAQIVPPTPDSLAGITQRGRMLASYDSAAWLATDAVVARQPSPGEFRGYLAFKRDGEWVVTFGRMSDDGRTYLIAYEARRNSPGMRSFDVTHHVPPRAETGELAQAARALDVARAAFGRVTRPYNAAVLPAGDGEWFVYLMPAQTQAGIFPLGADERFRVSADGRAIRGRRRLHNAVIEFGTPADTTRKGYSLEAGVQTAVLDNVPEDTDVFHVLVREPRVAQYVITDAFVYRVETSGDIRLLGRREEVLGKDGKLPR